MHLAVVFLVFAGFALADPKADPAAIVTFGNARFTMLTSRLLRMEWSNTATWEDAPTAVFLNRRMPVPPFQESHPTPVSLRITTEHLTLTYTPGDMGKSKFNQTNLMIKGAWGTWAPGQTDTGNLLGTVRTLDGVDGTVNLDCRNNPKAAELHCSYGIISKNGWVLHDDTNTRLLDNDPKMQWLIPRSSKDVQDWYMFGYGHEYREALGEFVFLAGRIPLPPRYALGIFFSRYWAFSSLGQKRIINEYEIHGTPLDVVVTDMDWHVTFYKDAHQGKKDQAGETLGWCGWSWDRHLFPYPAQFFSWCKSKGLRNTLNLHPACGVQPFEDLYPEMARYMGKDPASGRYIPFNITDRRFSDGLLDVVLKPVADMGVDFWWLDWQAWNTGNPSPTFWLNHAFFNNNERLGKDKRGMILHRWGGLGNHRYQVGFSGDVVPSWRSLEFQPFFTMTAANVLYGWWSHDLGGHTAPAESELYTRWVQWGAWSPIFRTHCTKDPANDRRIWLHPQPYFVAMRAAHQLRSQMVPYIYNEGYSSYLNGVSLVHPLYYDYPEIAEAYTPSQYMFGDRIMVAPVTILSDATTKLATVKIWIPPGKWIEWGSGQGFQGPQTISRTYDLDETPVFVKAGSVIVMLPDDKPLFGSAQLKYTSLLLNVFPYAAEQGSTTLLFEDDGESDGYLSGVFSETKFTYRLVNNTNVLVTVNQPRGHFPGMPTSRKYTVRLNGVLPPRGVTINGVAVTGWVYDGNTLALSIPVPQFSVHSDLNVAVEFSTPLSVIAPFTRCVARLDKVKEMLDNKWDWSHVWPQDYYPLQTAAVTGERISGDPSTAAKEVAAFPKALAESIKIMEGYKAVDSATIKRILALLHTC